jgi:hypothetical protein
MSPLSLIQGGLRLKLSSNTNQPRLGFIEDVVLLGQSTVPVSDGAVSDYGSIRCQNPKEHRDADRCDNLTATFLTAHCVLTDREPLPSKSFSTSHSFSALS